MNNSFTNAPTNKYTTSLGCLFIALPVIIYFVMVGKFAINIPFRDDYPSILTFLNNYKVASFSDRLALLFGQYNQHRLFSSRLVLVSYYAITGTINFRHIIFLGNTQLIFTLLIMVHFIRKALPSYWILPSFIMSLCIFDLSDWNNATWAMASLQNLGITFLMMASLYFYSLNKKAYLPLGILFQVISTFSSGNGIVASLLLVCYAILTKDRNKIVTTIAVFAICSPLYFFHYNNETGTLARSSIPSALYYFLHVLSGHFYYGRHHYFTDIVIGLSLLYIAAILFLAPIGKRLTIKKESAPFITIMLFALATVTLICLYRVITGFVPSRYMLYSNIITGLIFVFYLIRFGEKKFNNLVCIIFAGLMLLCYERNFKLGYAGMKSWKQDILISKRDPWTPSDPAIEKSVSDRSCQLGIYCIDKEKVKKEKL